MRNKDTVLQALEIARRRRAGFGQLSIGDVKQLLQRDDASLFRNLCDPENWELFPDTVLFALGAGAAPTAAENRRDRINRMQEHRRMARDLRQLAEIANDLEKRRKFEDAAHLNEAFAQTLEQLLADTLEDMPTPREERIRTQRELKALNEEYDQLRAKRHYGSRSKAQRECDERLAVVSDELARLQKTTTAVLAEEARVRDRVRDDWEALNTAKCMVAEERGRAKFKEYEPHIRARLCAQWRACEKVKQYEDETALSMAIGDVLMTLGSTVPVATLSVLVVKIGIKTFCNCPG